MSIKNTFISLLTLLLPIYAAGDGKMTFRQTGFADGLPHSDINDIVQDGQGYMWFATYGGLCKWDGYRMTVMTSGNSDLPRERVLCLCAASDSLLYIGTESGGLCIYDDRAGKFLEVDYDSPSSDDVVNCIFESRDGSIFVCHNNILSKIVWKDSAAAVKTVFKVPYSSTPITAAIDLEPDVILIGCGHSLYLIDSRNGNVSTFDDPGYNFWNDMVRGGDSEILLSSYSGLYVFDTETRSIIRRFENMCESVATDSRGDIWVGTNGNGLYRLDSRNFKVLNHFISSPQMSGQLTSSEISTLYEDKSGVLWIGTIGECISSLNLHDNNISLFTMTEGLSDERIITFGEDSTGNRLWVSTHYGGVNVMDTKEGTFRQISINGKHGRNQPIISSFYTDEAGNMMLGTWSHGIYTVPAGEIAGIYAGDTDLKAGKFLESYLHGMSVYKILKDPDGHLWISTSLGVIEYCPDQGNIREYRHDSNNDNTLSSDFVTDICITSGQNRKYVWIGTRLGLNQAVFENSSLIRWNRILLDGKGTHFISDIHSDRSGNLWVTALGGGLYRMDGKQESGAVPEFRNITPSGRGFMTNELESMLEDNAGNLWIGGYGIYKYSPGSNEVKIFTDKDNLQSNSFKIWAAHKLKDGRMAFGGIRGFNIFYPDSITSNMYVPRTVITGVYVNGKRIDGRNRIELRHDENNIVAEFSSLVYDNPVYNQYKYRLYGFEEDWHTTSGKDPRCIYSNLPAGKYDLVIYGSNSDGVWSATPPHLRFRIKPHPLAGPAAVIIYIFLLSASAVLLYRAVMSHLNERNVRKAEKEKLRFFTDIAHEIKTPLSLIAAPVEEVLNNPAIGHSTRAKLQLVDKSVNTLRSLVEQILDLRKYEDNMMKLYVSEIDMCRFLKEIAELFTPLASSRNIDFHTDFPDSPQFVYIDKVKMERVAVNLLSNAFKFTPEGGKITLSCTGDTKTVSFSVQDNGAGVSDADKEKIFDRFYQGKNGSDITGGSGIGLALSRYIVEHHKGTISVESKAGSGARFTVRLLKGKAHLDASQINDGYRNSDDLHNYDPLDSVPAAVPSSVSGKKATILVVDDNNNLREYLVSFLKSRYNVISAENGMRAYEIAIAEQPDLILSDVVMPEMSGIELCRRIKNNEATSHIIVILLTARNLVSTEIESWQTGADGFITKPFHLGILVSRIENLISSRDKLRKIFKSTLDVNPSEITIETSDEKFMKKCLDAIEKEMENPEFGVDSLCREVGVSRAQLYRKINSITGLSAIHFIRSIRLKRAAQILARDNSSVSDVMYKVGFNNASYFSKIFKEEFGCLPKEWRSRQDC